MAFTRQQVEQLLRPIHDSRVLSDGKGHSHVSQQDITAHLIRVFGFGSFDTEVISVECVFESERVNPKTGVAIGRWDVCYRALLRLTIRDPEGNTVCQFEDGSTATAQNQTRGDGHDLAYKSAISLAKKRCAINLGDQFGLSLYNKGQREALVRGTYVMPDGPAPHSAEDLQEGVPQQVSMGNDEVEKPLAAEVEPEPSAPALPPVEPYQAAEIAEEALKPSSGYDQLRELFGRAESLGVLDLQVSDGNGNTGTLRELINHLARLRGPVTEQQHRRMHALWNKTPLAKDRDGRLQFTAEIIGRPVTSSKELTAPEADAVIARLDTWIKSEGEAA